MNHLDAFEQRIREVLEPFEVPYNSADWAHMEKALDGGGRPSWWGGFGFYAALLAGALAVGGTTYVLVRSGNGTDPTDLTSGDRPPSGPEHTQGHSFLVEDDAYASSEEPVPTRPSAYAEGSTHTGGHMSTSSLPSSADGGIPATTTDRSGTAQEMGGPGSSGNDRSAPDVRDLPVQKKGPVESGPIESGTAEMTIRPSVTEGCPGTTVEFAAEHLPDEGIFLWNFGDGSFSNKANPSHTYSKGGRFEVMLSHSSMAGGNIRNKPSSDLIVIHEAPEAEFLPQRQSFEGHLPSIHFENRSLGGTDYLWDFGDGVTSSVPHPDHVFRKKGTYHVELIVTNARGCVDRMEKKVVVEHDYNLLAPEAFSPNGDGTNDLFIPEALRDLQLRFKLSIHDPASGELVYETTDASKPWTGRVMNRGDLCASGTYVWVVEFPDALHLSDIPFQGEVTLVR